MWESFKNYLLHKHKIILLVYDNNSKLQSAYIVLFNIHTSKVGSTEQNHNRNGSILGRLIILNLGANNTEARKK